MQHRLDATRLAPQQLHNVMVLLVVTIMAMIGLLHMMLTFPVLVIRILYGDDDADGDNMWQWLG